MADSYEVFERETTTVISDTEVLIETVTEIRNYEDSFCVKSRIYLISGAKVYGQKIEETNGLLETNGLSDVKKSCRETGCIINALSSTGDNEMRTGDNEMRNDIINIEGWTHVVLECEICLHKVVIFQSKLFNDTFSNWRKVCDIIRQILDGRLGREPFSGPMDGEHPASDSSGPLITLASEPRFKPRFKPRFEPRFGSGFISRFTKARDKKRRKSGQCASLDPVVSTSLGAPRATDSGTHKQTDELDLDRWKEGLDREQNSREAFLARISNLFLNISFLQPSETRVEKTAEKTRRIVPEVPKRNRRRVTSSSATVTILRSATGGDPWSGRSHDLSDAVSSPLSTALTGLEPQAVIRWLQNLDIRVLLLLVLLIRIWWILEQGVRTLLS
ncbi:hypothetical protein GNI_157100 [Gregarina niphandrodes]|uniref:Uncharacterized protein n=1 Tax=Gregarina niphandrodes TaxID=110365 RepID=A0A023B001_GRENI|nr:hypothetical protein GNI_157100 [Gregarina niphandrodes]EZG43870.1 hypothetical protein GNI_157100 [Gregarina niphandrodes]|eukprot:XP_011132958.1 hypothetical protein GNI_157100 [Gregarina niphandrodes]